MSDEDILTLYIERNEFAIAATEFKYQKDIQMVAKGIIFNDEDAKECVNDTYFALWNSVHINRPVHFRNYIIEIARRAACNILRKKLAKKRKAILIELFDMDVPYRLDMIYEPENRGILKSLMDFLSGQHEFNRMVFMMHYFKGISIVTIAAIYGKTTDQLKMLLYRMRQKLKKYLSEEEFTCF